MTSRKVRRGEEEGMHAELYYNCADSPFAIFTAASCIVNNSDFASSAQSSHQNSTLVITVSCYAGRMCIRPGASVPPSLHFALAFSSPLPYRRRLGEICSQSSVLTITNKNNNNKNNQQE